MCGLAAVGMRGTRLIPEESAQFVFTSGLRHNVCLARVGHLIPIGTQVPFENLRHDLKIGESEGRLFSSLRNGGPVLFILGFLCNRLAGILGTTTELSSCAPAAAEIHHTGLDAFGSRITLNGHPTERLPNTLNISFIGKAGSEILGRIKNLAASTGSACHFGSVELSPS
jgi:hypothetical protein